MSESDPRESAPAVGQAPAPRTAEPERFFGAARLMAVLTLGSRVLGMVRDVAILSLGASVATDVFWAAFTIPNLFRRLFGEGALSAAFIPVYSKVLQEGDPARSRAVLANATGVLAAVLAALVVAIELAAGAWLVFSGGSWDGELLARLVMIVLPFMFTVCLLALGSAALQCKGRFAYPAFAPILLNVCMIAAAAVLHTFPKPTSWPGLFLLAGSVVLAGVLQLAGVVWLLRRVGLWGRPALRPLLGPVRRVARLVLPMALPLGVQQFSAFYDRWYALWMTATAAAPQIAIGPWSLSRPLEAGAVTCIYAAGRLYMFPLGILAISLATAVFPLFSRCAARGDLPGLRRATGRAIRLSIFLGLPAGVGLIVLAGPILSLIYRHGNFTAADAARAARILQMYSVGMAAYFANHILLRAFYARTDARTPLRVSLLCSLGNVAMVSVGVFTPLRASAVGLATSLTAFAQAAVLATLLKRRLGGLGLRQIARSTVRIAAATGLMAAAAWTAARLLSGPAAEWAETLGMDLLEPLTVALGGLVAGAVTYAAAAMALRCPEAGELLRRGEGKAESSDGSNPPERPV
jgi:putative peptidoglycan lipid II flippase